MQGAATHPVSPSPLRDTSLLIWDQRVSAGSSEELGFATQPLPEPPHHPQEMLSRVNEPHQKLKFDSWEFMGEYEVASALQTVWG